jgi:hypothetical protein
MKRPLVMAVCAVVTATAHAQTAPQAQSPQHEADTNTLEEITITARKRVESVQSIPESVAAIGSQVLDDAHITKMDDIGGLVSNLNIATQSDNSPGAVLRGVGSFGVVQGVGFYANDVQLFDGQTVRPDDLERIEVLKGPQGTLYGGSNIGGAIKYITKLPTATFEGSTTLEVGGYDTQTYAAIVSGPLIASSPDMLDARLCLAQGVTLGHIEARNPRTSRIFEWNGTKFVDFQTLDGQWGYNWESFQIDGQTFLGYADHAGESLVFKWDGTDAAVFRADDKQFLAVSNSLTPDVRFRTDTIIYGFNG